MRARIDRARSAVGATDTGGRAHADLMPAQSWPISSRGLRRRAPTWRSCGR
jgi:hypothetical protein